MKSRMKYHIAPNTETRASTSVKTGNFTSWRCVSSHRPPKVPATMMSPMVEPIEMYLAALLSGFFGEGFFGAVMLDFLHNAAHAARTGEVGAGLNRELAGRNFAVHFAG